jgi:hypothetical protein
MKTLSLIALLLLAGAPARAAEPADPTAPAPARAPALGAALDLGVVDGLAASVLYRPWSPLRLRAGPAWNYVSWGVQAGVDVLPVRWAVTPALSIEATHHFDADLSRFVRASSGTSRQLAPLLRKVPYDGVSLLAGVEIGSQRGLSVSLRAGLGWIWLASKGRADLTSSSSSTTYYVVSPKLHGTVPCAKLGLQYAF